MKKLMLTLGFAALCGAVLPANAAIESGTVGYTTTQIQGTDANDNVKWYLIGVQFKEVTGEADQIKLGEAILLNGIDAWSGKWRDRSKGPMLEVYNGTGYDIYYFVSAELSGTGSAAWMNDSQQDASNVYLHPGEAFWFCDKALGTATGSLVVKGGVKTGATATVDIDANTLQTGTNPFPMSVKIKDIGCSLTPFSGKWRNRATGIILEVWNGTGYDMYYYVSADLSGTESAAWVDDNQSVATAELPAGGAFWLKTTGETGTLTFSYSQSN